MNEKEIGEIRKRFKPDRNNITRVRGCYINEKKEIISKFDQSLALMSVEETEEVLGILRKTLLGGIGKNLHDISFTNNQVLDSDEHRLLTRLKDSSLSDDEAFDTVISRIKDSFVCEENFMIVFACDKYDVPSYSSDGNRDEDSSSVYSYIVCSICPVKLTRSALGYHVTENRFRNVTPDRVVSSPEAGFLFPAFDGRTSNIYNSLFYTKSSSLTHEALIASVFNCSAPMPADEQKMNFSSLLRQTVSEDCSYGVVRSVQEKIGQMIEEHKASKDPDPLVVSKNNVSDILENCGVDEEKIEQFKEKFDDTFGKRAEVAPSNLLNVKKIEIKTPEVNIKLPAEMAELVETRIIDGTKYILIRAEGSVEVNGVEIKID